MDENEEINPVSTEEGEQNVKAVYPDHPPAVDEFLWSYIKGANTGAYDGSFLITLFVKGKLVSGFLIGEKTYLSRVARMQSEGANFPSLDDPSSVDECRRIMHDSIVSHTNTEENYRDDVDASYFIHLSNVSLLISDNWAKCDLWRGRLSEVDGFVWGAFSKS